MSGGTRMDKHRELMDLEQNKSAAEDLLADVLREARDKGLHTHLGFSESIAIQQLTEVSNLRDAVKQLLQGVINHEVQPASEEVRELAGSVQRAIDAFEEANRKLQEFKDENAA